MKQHKNLWLVVALLAALVLSLGAGYVLAQGPQPGASPNEERPAQPADAPASVVRRAFTYQGRLLENGSPAEGTYQITFRLYDASVDGTEVWSTTQGVNVTAGLFNTVLGPPPDNFNGQALWLALEIGGEVLQPRQEIVPAPYALSLPPGARIGGSDVGHGSLYLQDDTGEMVFGLTANNALLDIGGTGEDGDIYLRDDADAVTFSADGATGTINSAAYSYLWVSAANITEVNGDVDIVRTAGGPIWVIPNTADAANVELPADIPLMLYGQPVRVEMVELCIQTMGTGNYIDRFRVYKIDNTGTATTTVDIEAPFGGSTYICYPFVPDAEKQLMASDEAGLMVKVDLHFDGTGNANRIVLYGVRIRLRHDG